MYYTYVAGSNILANIKHWVAMGGAGWAVAIGTPVVVFRFNAAAAGAGIWRPVPTKQTKKVSFIHWTFKLKWF